MISVYLDSFIIHSLKKQNEINNKETVSVWRGYLQNGMHQPGSWSAYKGWPATLIGF